MLQVVFHYSAELSGWLLAPIAISSVLMKPLISPITPPFRLQNHPSFNCHLSHTGDC
ncbi:hypothetical protein AAUPMC_18364, partial [Pasteurella multocida subsp. multocida str. Anand1_cattle]